MIKQKSMVSLNEGDEVSQERWLVAMVRRPETEHSFLLIEGIDPEGEWRLFRADLFVDENKPIFEASGMILSGIATIRKVEADLNDLIKMENNGGWYEQSWPVTQERAIQLMDKIEESSREDIKYALPGDGSIYRGSRSSAKVHNCVTWCTEQLRAIAIPVHGSWTDQFVVRPSRAVPGDSHEPGRSSCVIL